MCTVADRPELPAGFRPQPLTTQAGGSGFDIEFRQLVSKTGSTVSLFCLSECLTNSSIAYEPELLTRAYLISSQTPDIELRLVKAEFTGCSGHADASGQLKGFFTKFRYVLLTGLLAA